MKSNTLAVAVVFLTAGAANADPKNVYGTWLTQAGSAATARRVARSPGWTPRRCVKG